MRNALWCALLALGLVACESNDKASNDISDVVSKQIENKTCDEQSPEELNDRELTDAGKTIDVDGLDPDCSG